MAVARQGPLGQQLVGAHRPRRLGPAGGGTVGGQGPAGTHVGMLEVVDGRADHDRSGAEELEDHAGPLGGVVDPVPDPSPLARSVSDAAEQHHEAVALAGAQRIHASGPRRPAYVVEQVGLTALVRHRAEYDGHGAALAPPQRAGARQHGLVGLGAEDRVDHQGLEAGVPGAAYLGGPGVDLRGREGDLATVAEHAGVDVGRVSGVEHVVEVGLHDLDAQAHQVDGLLEADGPGQVPRGRPEDLGCHRGPVELGVPHLVGVPVDEALDARLHDDADPGAVLGAELGEPRHLVVHPRHRGGAELPGGPVQVADRPRAGVGSGEGGHGRAGWHQFSVLEGGSGTNRRPAGTCSG